MTASNATPAGEEGAVSVLAYGIWEAEGRPHGRDKDHCLMAKDLVTEVPDPHDAVDGTTEAQPGEIPDHTTPDHTHVRPAGRKKMDMPPKTWTKTDEEIDESFPASDPPGNY